MGLQNDMGKDDPVSGCEKVPRACWQLLPATQITTEVNILKATGLCLEPKQGHF